MEVLGDKRKGRSKQENVDPALEQVQGGRNRTWHPPGRAARPAREQRRCVGSCGALRRAGRVSRKEGRRKLGSGNDVRMAGQRMERAGDGAVDGSTARPVGSAGQGQAFRPARSSAAVSEGGASSLSAHQSRPSISRTTMSIQITNNDGKLSLKHASVRPGCLFVA